MANSKVGGKASAAYQIVGQTSVFERMFDVFHLLGIQSNLVLSARYASSDETQTLDKRTIVNALRGVVEKHAELRVVHVRTPSSRRGHHDLLKATLNTIDLEACVEFDKDDGRGVDSAMLERLHNQWEWMSNPPDRPWWKVVVKGRDVTWVYHHGIADGMSGFVFHRELLAELNKNSIKGSSSSSSATTTTIVDAGSLASEPPRDPLLITKIRVRWWELIWHNLVSIFLDLFLKSWLVNSTLPPSRPYLRDLSKPATPASCTVTRISSHRIPASQMAQILAACRANDTTFTPLLIVLLIMTMATDQFPDARITVSRYAFDMRPFLDMAAIGGGTPAGTIFNASAGGQHPHWLKRFRNVDKRLTAKIPGDMVLVWDLVREYRNAMNRSRSGVGARLWKSGSLMGTTIEEFIGRSFSSLSTILPNTLHVSNLGAFSPKPVVGDGTEVKSSASPWTIDDMQFSVAATNGTLGSHGIILSVSGVKGGDTIINAAYEEGVVSRDMADDVLQGIMDRIEILIAYS